MSRIAFIFPGQGAQTCGMGKDFYEQTETGKRVFSKTSELLGFSMPQLYFKQNNRLDITEYTQTAMVTTSTAMMEVLGEKGVKPDIAAELSLGEYCALAASGVMSAEDAIRAVRRKGILMQEAVPVGEGAMAAVLALGAPATEAVTGAMEGVWIANYNCPGQIVVSGKKAAVEEACGELRAAGAKRALMLNINDPFHSGMLAEADGKLAKMLEGAEIHAPQIPYIASVNAEFMTTAEPVRELLTRQVSFSVRWQQSMEVMIAGGVDAFIEVRPGKTLAGLMKKVSREVRILNMEELEDIGKIVGALQ